MADRRRGEDAGTLLSRAEDMQQTLDHGPQTLNGRRDAGTALGCAEDGAAACADRSRDAEELVAVSLAQGKRGENKIELGGCCCPSSSSTTSSTTTTNTTNTNTALSTSTSTSSSQLQQ